MNTITQDRVMSVLKISLLASRIAERLVENFQSTHSEVSTSSNRDDPVELSTEEKLFAAQMEIESLKATVAALHQRLDEEIPDAQFSDEQAANFMQTFEESVKELPPFVATSVYDHKYFLSLPNNVRYLICTALVNAFTIRNLQPASLWYQILANHGSLS